MRATIFFKEKKAGRYGLPAFLRTLSGDIIMENNKIVSIIPLRCLKRKARNIDREDIEKIDYFS